MFFPEKIIEMPNYGQKGPCAMSTVAEKSAKGKNEGKNTHEIAVNLDDAFRNVNVDCLTEEEEVLVLGRENNNEA
jgi:hypothetical protein